MVITGLLKRLKIFTYNETLEIKGKRNERQRKRETHTHSEKERKEWKKDVKVFSKMPLVLIKSSLRAKKKLNVNWLSDLVFRLSTHTR